MQTTTTRNYILFPAQTNLELCLQMDEMGYSTNDIEAVHNAYMFNIDKTFSMFRGSGKPFINHLVGVASIMVSDKQSVPMIQAALMHALYQNRVNFGRLNNIEEKREAMRTVFGSEVDDLIWRYTQFEMVAIEQIDSNDLNQFKDVLILRIADEVEDLTNFGLMFHGRKEDSEDVHGSGLFRMRLKMQQSSKIVEITRSLGLPRLQDAVEYWYSIPMSSTYSNSVKTGYYSSKSLMVNNKES